MGRVQQLEKAVRKKREGVDWGVPVDRLPSLTWTQVYAESTAGKVLIVIGGFVYDVTSFVESHPGGKSLLITRKGHDATAAFNGGIYSHSNAANNLLLKYRMAALQPGPVTN